MALKRIGICGGQETAGIETATAKKTGLRRT